MLSLPSLLKDHAESIFNNIRWSSAHTLEDQVMSIEAVACAVRSGDSYVDIDTIDDVNSLLELCQELTREGADIPCPQTLAAIAALLH